MGRNIGVILLDYIIRQIKQRTFWKGKNVLLESAVEIREVVTLGMGVGYEMKKKDFELSPFWESDISPVCRSITILAKPIEGKRLI